jgi:hypothetical protein
VLLMLNDEQVLSENSPVELTIPGVINQAHSGLSESFAMRTVTAAGDVIDHSLYGTATKIMPDMLSAASVELLSAEAGAMSSVQVFFTLSNPLPANGKIAIVFPRNVVLQYPASNGYLEGIVGMLGISSYVPQINGRCPQGVMSSFGCNVTLTVDGEETPSGSTVSFGITNVGLMHHAGFTGSYVLQTRTMDGAVIDEATVNHSSVTPSKLGFAFVAPVGVMRASHNTTFNVGFTLANPVLTGGFVHVIFPPLFNLSDTCYSVGGCGHLGVSGIGVALYTTESNSLLISVTQDFAAQADMQLTITGVKAPVIGGLTGTYQIKTVTAGGVDIDVDLDVEQAITAPATMQADLSLDSYETGHVSTVTVQVNVTSAIPAQGGMFEMVLPFGASASKATVETWSGFDGSPEI